ncbi:hypothetical protein EBR37_02075 [bacterium]|nr:hypothetical protein [bacterium]
MANPVFNINLQYPQITSATKKIEKNQANFLLRIIQEITVKGKLLKFNNLSGYSEIWAQIDAIQDNKSAKNCTLNFANLVSYSGVKITSISFDQTNNQDVQSKDFSITFEVYEAVSSSGLTQYGVTTTQLKDLEDIKITQVKDQNLEGETLTTSVGITFTPNANTFNESIANTIAKAVLAATNILSLTSSRTTVSNVYDEKTATYTYIEVKNKFRGSGGGFAILRSNNYNIQNNGSILVTDNTQIKIESNTYTINELYSRALSEASGALGRCQQFLNIYYSFSYGTPPAGYRNTFLLFNKQITVDEASGTAQASASITNEPEYTGNVKVEIVSTIEDLKKEDSKRKTVRGTITGINNPPDKEINPTSNKKLAAAKNYFDSNYKPKFISAKNFIDAKGEITGAKYKAYITNGDVSYNISEGSINFSLTYESRPNFDVSESTMIYGSAELTNQSAVHLANQFIIIGGQTPGEELIQESNQSRPIEQTLKVQALFKKPADIKNYISKFKDLISQNYNDGIIKSINISSIE